ncbi:MAG: MFS transporter [Maricaulaceae bacterium]|nr:MFS transporter [Maricaulaceae bacterium]
MSDAPVTDQPAARPLSGAYRKYALGMLLVIYTLNFLDRQIVNILAEPIKLELGLADWQLGALTGLAFAIFYTTLGIPIARLAERADRVKIISAAVVVWSAFTVACGFAVNFTQLLLARIGVGVGEAGCTPPAHSLITDYTPKEKRASALAFYSMGIPLGSLAGMALGGLVADAWGWRAAFFVAGAPGVLIGIITFLTLPEPRRNAGGKVKMAKGPGLMEAFEELRSKSSFWWVSIASAISAFISYGHIAFYGSFYFRNHAEGLAAMTQSVNETLGLNFGPVGFVGTALGLIVGIFGAAGTYVGGMLADRAARTDIRGYVLIPAWAALLVVPFFVAAMLVPSVGMSFLILIIPVFLGSLWYGPIFASVQSLAQPRTRATAAAVLLFIINLVGLGLGPLSIGLLSDVFAAQMGVAEGLRWSMIVFGAAGLLTGAGYFLASRRLREQIAG